MRMVGNSIGSAPSSARRSDSALACSRARVTNIRGAAQWPSGSNQVQLLGEGNYLPDHEHRRRLMPRSIARAAMVPSVATSVSWSGVVPQRTSAAGSSADRPPRWSRAAMPPSCSTPIRTTSVSLALAPVWPSRATTRA